MPGFWDGENNKLILILFVLLKYIFPMAGIYIHIPFCKSFCSYCDFYSITDNSLKDALVQAVIRESSIRPSYSKEKPWRLFISVAAPRRCLSLPLPPPLFLTWRKSLFRWPWNNLRSQPWWCLWGPVHWSEESRHKQDKPWCAVMGWQTPSLPGPPAWCSSVGKGSWYGFQGRN